MAKKLNLNNLSGQVEYCLANFEDTRNSDIELTIKVWQTFWNVGETINVRKMFDLPREDNVKRIRAKLNAENKYMPTSYEVMKGRGLNEALWRQMMGWPVGDTKVLQAGDNKSLNI